MSSREEPGAAVSAGTGPVAGGHGQPACVRSREALKSDRIQRLQRMFEIRLLEDRILSLFSEGLVHGSTHTCQGQEAVAVGLAVAANVNDAVTCTYRGHGMALALGVQPEAILGEVLGRVCGSLGGVGGSMHLCEPDVGLLPTFAIVGAGIPVAVGAALTAQVHERPGAALAVFGDGTTNIGAFHEALNLAAIWRLPVVFVCENNLYGEYSRIDRTTPVADIATRATSYAMPAEIVDGQDADEVERAVRAALDHARSGQGPVLLEMKTYRYAGHSRSDPATYRPEGELDKWLARDPITIYGARLIDEGRLDAAGLEACRQAAETRIDEATAIALESPEPEVSTLFGHVYAENEMTGSSRGK